MGTHVTKAVFLDLDGTLLNDKKEVTPKNARAIRQALADGHKIVLASGRAPSSVAAQAEKIGLAGEGCYAIACNGACIFDLSQSRAVYCQNLPLAAARHVLRAAEEFGIYAQTYVGDKILAGRDTAELRAYARATAMEYLLSDDVCQALQEDPQKILVIHYEADGRLAQFQKLVMDQVRDQADSYFSCPYYLEVVAKGVSKGSAARRLCQLLGIPMEQTVAAGDAENDISMITAAQVGAVLKNADPSLRKYGDYVTEKDNNHDAVAEILEKFVL